MLEAEETRKGGGRNCSNSRRGIVGGKMEKKEGKRGSEREGSMKQEFILNGVIGGGGMVRRKMAEEGIFGGE